MGKISVNDVSASSCIKSSVPTFYESQPLDYNFGENSLENVVPLSFLFYQVFTVRFHYINLC